MRFNPPPGWPPAPEGWRPGAGWRPDESWPPVPPGWKIWIEDPRSLVSPLVQESASPAPRKSSVIGRALLRNTIFAAVASIIGPIGFKDLANPGTTFSGFVTGVLAAFIFFWGLRVPTALLELYITKRHSRRWIFWPHGLALGTAVVAIAGNEANPGRSPVFRHVLSIQAATVGLLYYLICALAYMILATIVILIINLVPSRTGTGSSPSRVAESVTATSPQAVTNRGVRSRIARVYRTRNRDAAVLAVSIVTAVAGLVQGLDIHDIGRTILALAVGATGLFWLYKLPNTKKASDEIDSPQLGGEEERDNVSPDDPGA